MGHHVNHQNGFADRRHQLKVGQGRGLKIVHGYGWVTYNTYCRLISGDCSKMIVKRC